MNERQEKAYLGKGLAFPLQINARGDIAMTAGEEDIRQAIRIILPPLGNDLIAMLKDSSLISILALEDTLQLGRQFISRSFRAFEGYNTVAFLYLVLTMTLSVIVAWIERRTRTSR